jgi:uncharacterized cupin superfamily protein
VRPVVNLFEVGVTADADDPDGYRTAYARLGPLVGGAALGMSVYELAPGQSICPYHYELSDEEWLVCLRGTPTLRTPEGQAPLRPGDVVCFPAGAAGAHKLTAGDEPARVAILSTKNPLGVAVYPDSRKLGVWFRDEHHMVRLEPPLDYWDGEVGIPSEPGTVPGSESEAS